ncbi:MAG: MarR family winged helix-turn-helix transcriptional regulator [Janthinobacterium lividum]
METVFLENQLCFKLYALSRQITNLYRPLLEEIGLTYPQYLVMLLLWQENLLSVKALGERLYLDSGTLTPLLKRLQQKQLLTRIRDVADERSVLVELTDAGRKMQQKAKCIPEELNKTLGLDAAEHQAIKSTLDQMLMQLN